MLKIFKEKNTTMQLVPQEHIPRSVLLQCLIFLAVFIVAEVCASIPALIPMMTAIFNDMNHLLEVLNNEGMEAYSNAVMEIGYTPTVMAISLYGTVLATLIVLLFCKLIERRPMKSLGFSKDGCVKKYLVGCLVGAVMISICVWLSVAFGGMTISFNHNIDFLQLLVFFFGFILQGASEETIFRGYFLNTVASKGRIVLAVVLNSVFFGLAHSFNMGLTPLAFLNLVLFGVFASVYAMHSDSLWGVCGVHSLWNFMQGNFWGIQVSGTDTGTSIFLADTTPNATLLNGGAFGLEGSIFVTITLIASIGIVLFLSKSTKIVDE
jgi:hypothetical protein